MFFYLWLIYNHKFLWFTIVVRQHYTWGYLMMTTSKAVKISEPTHFGPAISAFRPGEDFVRDPPSRHSDPFRNTVVL